MNDSKAVDISAVSFRYPGKRSRRREVAPRQALSEVTFDVPSGECFALLGPNGGGKTTLFRLLATLVPPQEGSVSIFGHDVRDQLNDVRQRMGVVFQASSLDRKLTVRENLQLQAALYGLYGSAARSRCDELVERFGLGDEKDQFAEKLSGGQRRRVELAKGLLHEPDLLLLDEPTSGLDPGARSDLWNYLERMRAQQGVTIVFTTHLLEEAERAERIGILSKGRLVALGAPQQLRDELGQRVITIQSTEPELLAQSLPDLDAQPMGEGRFRIEDTQSAIDISALVARLDNAAHTITVGKPTLEDVFIKRTGHQFWSDDE